MPSQPFHQLAEHSQSRHALATRVISAVELTPSASNVEFCGSTRRRMTRITFCSSTTRHLFVFTMSSAEIAWNQCNMTTSTGLVGHLCDEWTTVRRESELMLCALQCRPSPRASGVSIGAYSCCCANNAELCFDGARIERFNVSGASANILEINFAAPADRSSSAPNFEGVCAGHVDVNETLRVVLFAFNTLCLVVAVAMAVLVRQRRSVGHVRRFAILYEVILRGI